MSIMLQHGIPFRNADALSIKRYLTLAELPTTGSTKVLYVVGQDENVVEYRWDTATNSYIPQTAAIDTISGLSDELDSNRSMAKRDVIISTATPNNSVGQDGDIWIQIV